jgi:hypothetical protein
MPATNAKKRNHGFTINLFSLCLKISMKNTSFGLS